MCAIDDCSWLVECRYYNSTSDQSDDMNQRVTLQCQVLKFCGWLCLTVKSRTLLFSADDADVSTSDMSSSCGYHNALLSWLTGSFCRSTRHQQSAAARVDVPRDVDNDNNGTEADGRLLVHDKTDDRITATAVEPVTAKEHNETWTTMSELMTASQSGIVSSKLNVTYTATADVISVLE